MISAEHTRRKFRLGKCLALKLKEKKNKNIFESSTGIILCVATVNWVVCSTFIFGLQASYIKVKERKQHQRIQQGSSRSLTGKWIPFTFSSILSFYLEIECFTYFNNSLLSSFMSFASVVGLCWCAEISRFRKNAIMRANSVASWACCCYTWSTRIFSFHFIFCVSRCLYSIFWSHIADVKCTGVRAYVSTVHILRFYSGNYSAECEKSFRNPISKRKKKSCPVSSMIDILWLKPTTAFMRFSSAFVLTWKSWRSLTSSWKLMKVHQQFDNQKRWFSWRFCIFF